MPITGCTWSRTPAKIIIIRRQAWPARFVCDLCLLWCSSCYDMILLVTIVDRVRVTNFWLSARVLGIVAYIRQARKLREKRVLRISPTLSYYSTSQISRNRKTFCAFYVQIVRNEAVRGLRKILRKFRCSFLHG